MAVPQLRYPNGRAKMPAPKRPCPKCQRALLYQNTCAQTAVPTHQRSNGRAKTSAPKELRQILPKRTKLLFVKLQQWLMELNECPPFRVK